MKLLFDPGTEKWVQWAKMKAQVLAELRVRLGLPRLQRAYVPESGTFVFVNATSSGLVVRITGGIGSPYFLTLGDVCSCLGAYTDAVEFVVLSSVRTTVDSTVTTTISAKVREVQRYNSAVVWSGEWFDASYSLATTSHGADDPDTTVETYSQWYVDATHVLNGVKTDGGILPGTPQTVEQAFGLYPEPADPAVPDTPSTCSLVTPVLSTAPYVTAGLGAYQTNATSPAIFSSTQMILFQFTPSALSRTYSPVTGYVQVHNPDAGRETFSLVGVASDAGAIDTSVEAAYVWSLGYSSVRRPGFAGSPERAQLAADQAAYDAEYPLWLAREEAREAGCLAAVPALLALDMTDDGFASAVAAATRHLNGQFFAQDGLLPLARSKVNVYLLEYDYVVDGIAGHGSVIPAGTVTTVSKVYLASGKSTFLYREDLPALAPFSAPLTAKEHVGESIEVSSAFGNVLVMLIGPDGAERRKEFLARLLEKDNVVADLDADSDKLLSLLYVPIPDPL